MQKKGHSSDHWKLAHAWLDYFDTWLLSWHQGGRHSLTKSSSLAWGQFYSFLDAACNRITGKMETDVTTQTDGGSEREIGKLFVKTNQLSENSHKITTTERSGLIKD